MTDLRERADKSVRQVATDADFRFADMGDVIKGLPQLERRFRDSLTHRRPIVSARQAPIAKRGA